MEEVQLFVDKGTMRVSTRIRPGRCDQRPGRVLFTAAYRGRMGVFSCGARRMVETGSFR